jgi:hypothetical protein
MSTPHCFSLDSYILKSSNMSEVESRLFEVLNQLHTEGLLTAKPDTHYKAADMPRPNKVIMFHLYDLSVDTVEDIG